MNLMIQNRQAMLLLTSELTPYASPYKPLTIAEWKRFAEFLKIQQKQPADCLMPDANIWLKEWQDPKKSENPISYERLMKLLERGNELAFAMERWDRAGIWVITRSQLEQHYPRRLKQQLGQNAPPVLFGCGNLHLLNGEAKRLAVVGSRNASQENHKYAYQIGKQAAFADITIVSGGAKGIDESAMLGAMKNNGKVIGVIADNLLNYATNPIWRESLRNGFSVFISPFNPEARFNKFNAMARNDYIYCLSDSSLVVQSGNKGGTFSGAEKNLKKNWVTLWVNQDDPRSDGNQSLIQMGGKPISGLLNQPIDILFKEEISSKKYSETQIDLFQEENILESENEQNVIQTIKSEAKPTPLPIKHQFYQLFIDYLQQNKTPKITLTQLKNDTGLSQSQLKIWIELAIQEGRLSRIKNYYELA